MALLAGYNKTPADLQEYVQTFKQWYVKQPHLPKQELSEEIIEGHLMNKSFSLECCKQIYDNYLSARNKMAEFLMNRDPCSEEIVNAFKSNRLAVLPRLTPDKFRVTMLKPIFSQIWSLLSAIKVCIMSGEYRVRNDVLLGEHVVFDVEDWPLPALAHCPPALVAKSLSYITSCAGAKMKGLHIVNPPSYLLPIVELVKISIKPKLAKRVKLYENYEQLFKVLPKTMFPKDFGGDEPTLNEISDLWIKTFQAPGWRRWFIEQDQVLVDESKRSNKSTAFDDIFGAEGFFRNMDID